MTAEGERLPWKEIVGFWRAIPWLLRAIIVLLFLLGHGLKFVPLYSPNTEWWYAKEQIPLKTQWDVLCIKLQIAHLFSLLGGILWVKWREPNKE